LTKKSVSIIDYGLGNLFSVKQACISVGLDPIITSNSIEILKSDMVILPGVGAFGFAMENLRKTNLDKTLKTFAQSGKPFIGICLGMQLMLSESVEFGIHKGLNIIPGKTKKFKNEIDEKSTYYPVPQIQWNTLKKSDSIPQNNIFDFIKTGDYMYFVHSFYCLPEDDDTVIATTKYAGVEYPSIIQSNNCIGIQFHPEKSGLKGIEIYKKLKLLK